ncbi:MAG: hypothetical protein H7Y15_07815, partial [Pseudonocardia sp.]|nr:hypothetical protein [Pseudonocardia sp.]
MRRLLAEGLTCARHAGDDTLSAEAALWAAAGAVFERDLPVAGELLGHAEHHAELVDDALTAAHVVVTRGMVALLSGRV